MLPFTLSEWFGVFTPFTKTSKIPKCCQFYYNVKLVHVKLIYTLAIVILEMEQHEAHFFFFKNPWIYLHIKVFEFDELLKDFILHLNTQLWRVKPD
jgi:hypothetical protein